MALMNCSFVNVFPKNMTPLTLSLGIFRFLTNVVISLTMSSTMTCVRVSMSFFRTVVS